MVSLVQFCCIIPSCVEFLWVIYGFYLTKTLYRTLGHAKMMYWQDEIAHQCVHDRRPWGCFESSLVLGRVLCQKCDALSSLQSPISRGSHKPAEILAQLYIHSYQNKKQIRYVLSDIPVLGEQDEPEVTIMDQNCLITLTVIQVTNSLPVVVFTRAPLLIWRILIENSPNIMHLGYPWVVGML